MTEGELRGVLNGALFDLHRAITGMLCQTIPVTAPPRPRVFWLTPTIRWPTVLDKPVDGRTVMWLSVIVERRLSRHMFLLSSLHQIMSCLIEETSGQPARILRVLRRIQAATAWCQARREGRERAARMMLHEQRRAVELLQAEQVGQALRGGRP